MDNHFPVLPQRIVKAVRDILPPDGIVTLDNRVYKIWFARNYKAYNPNIIILDNALVTGEVMQLINDHDPIPLYYQMEAENKGQFDSNIFNRDLTSGK